MQCNNVVTTTGSSVYSDIPEGYALEVGALAVLGKNIKAARAAAGMTQIQLAEKTGISQSDISKFERTGRLHTEQVLLIADACRVSAGDLFAATAVFVVNVPPVDPDLLERLAVTKTAERATAFLDLDDDLQEWLLDLPAVLAVLLREGAPRGESTTAPPAETRSTRGGKRRR